MEFFRRNRKPAFRRSPGIFKLLFVLFFAVPMLFYTIPVESGQETKVVILGFDGADPVLTKKWMQQGLLPNLALLKEQGSFSPLGTTNPPQSLVAWASFATGKDPGQTGIVDSFDRDPQTYFLGYPLTKEGKKDLFFGANNAIIFSTILSLVLGCLFLFARRLLKLNDMVSVTVITVALVFIGYSAYYQIKSNVPEQLPTTFNKRKGRALWEIAGENQIKTHIVRVPATFPAPNVEEGQILGGRGTPDIRGSLGTYSYFTDASGSEGVRDTERGGKVISLKFEGGKTETYIFGPQNKLFQESKPVHLPLTLVKEGTDYLTIEAADKMETLQVGQWSNWFAFDFEFNPAFRLRGMSRFKLLALKPHVKLYMPPIHVNPEHAPMKISHPQDHAKSLFERFGLFPTIGRLGSGAALADGLVDEATFLQDLYFSVGKLEEMLYIFLDDKQTRLFIQVFDFTDEAGQAFGWQGEANQPENGNALRDAYIRMDKIVGKTMKKLEANTIFMVLSSHGIAPVHKSMNINRWLVENGFMVLTSEKGSMRTMEDLMGNGRFWDNVDWSHTKAYALGFGGIYLNLQEREKNGIVSPEEVEWVQSEIIKKLEAFTDEETGERPVFKVYKREEIYSDFDERTVPDLRLATNKGYEVSLQTSLGGIPPKVLVAKSRKGSGGNDSLDPSQVPGFLLINKKVELKKPHLLDIFPTLCNFFGIHPPSDLRGKAWDLAPSRIFK